MNLEWNVLYYNSNTRRIEQFNIFDHASFNKVVMKMFDKSKLIDMAEFEDAIDKEVMYFFWCRAEYEVMIGGLFKKGVKTKIDIYTQLKLNWDRFIDYLWNEYTSK